MKKLNFISAALFILVILASCKKENTDDRDQFIGTWKGNITISVPGLAFSTTEPLIQTISKGTKSDQEIIITQGNETYNAYVNGNSYTYDDFTMTQNVNGSTISMEFTGIGSINGSVIAESGTVKFFTQGKEYPGSWSSTINKQ